MVSLSDGWKQKDYDYIPVYMHAIMIINACLYSLKMCIIFNSM